MELFRFTMNMSMMMTFSEGEAQFSYVTNRSIKKLDYWLRKRKIVGIVNLDTRIITNYIRDKGAPKGVIQFSKKGKHNTKKLIKNRK